MFKSVYVIDGEQGEYRISRKTGLMRPYGVSEDGNSVCALFMPNGSKKVYDLDLNAFDTPEAAEQARQEMIAADLAKLKERLATDLEAHMELLLWYRDTEAQWEENQRCPAPIWLDNSTPRISDIGRIETLYDDQGEPQQVWIEQSSQLFQEAKAKFERGEFLIKVEKEFEQVSEQPKGLNLATPSLELDDYSDYLSNQERWRAEIEELLTTVCPSVEIRRNHKNAFDLYSIHEKERGDGGFAVLHTLTFVRFLRSAKEDGRSFSGSELCLEWKNYVRKLTT